MYLSLKYIEEFSGLEELILNDLLDRLILAGFEIEAIQSKKIKKKTYLILDVSITANRADVSNIKGFAFEILSLYNTNLPLQTPIHIRPLLLLKPNKNLLKSLNFLYTPDINYKILRKSDNFLFSCYYKFFLSNFSLWEHYLQKKYFRKILKNFKNKRELESSDYLSLLNIQSQDFKVTQSPFWLKKRLLMSNFQSINNVIDTIHYIMLETGQVFFAYDLHVLKELTNNSDLSFILNYAKNTDFLNLSKNEYLTLNDKILTFKLKDKVISIAGIIQDVQTIVTNQTSNILIQGGLYNSRQIKQSSKLLSIKTEYSLKLEKRIDLNLFEQGYLRLLYLFWVQGIKFNNVSINNDFILSTHKNSFLWYYIKYSKKKIKINYKNIKKLIGPHKNLENLENSIILKNLKLLNFKISYKTNENCYLIVPLTRQQDIEREVDIIEEIVRSLEFSEFYPILPNTNNFGSTTKLEKFKRRLKIYFLNYGFNENLHSILTKNNIIYETKLENPLLSNSSALRISLLSTLITKFKTNSKKYLENFETFELGRVYKFLSNGETRELELISGIFGGKQFRTSWTDKSSTLNWFEAKGLLEDIFGKLNISVNWVQANFTNFTNFHPNRTANILIGKQILGTFGQIHPTLVLAGSLNKKIYMFELNLEILSRFWKNKNTINYIPYSSYPMSYIDLSCKVNKNLSFEKIKQKIYKLGQPLLYSIELFDYYTQAPIEKGYCSLSFKLKFKSESRTLLNSEINQTIQLIIANLEKFFDITFD